MEIKTRNANSRAFYYKRRNNVDYYVVDIDVLPDEEEITLGGEYQDGCIGGIHLIGIMKQFPQVKTINICEDVYQIEFDNFLFPNVEKVVSKSKHFKSGRYLVSNGGMLLNAFCQNEDAVLDLKGISSIGNYALSGCRFKSVENADLSDMPVLTERAMSGCLIMPEDPETGRLDFGNYVYSVDDAIDEVWIPETVKGFSGHMKYGKKVTVEGPAALEKLIYNLMRNSGIVHDTYDVSEIHMEIENAAVAAKIVNICRNKYLPARSVTVGENPYVKTVDGILYSKDGRVLIYCPFSREGTVNVPEGVEYISDYAFSNARISAVNLPDSLREIGNDAFARCENLSSVSFGRGITEINGIDIFSRSGLKEIVFPPQLRKIGEKAFRMCDSLENVVFNEGLEEIGDSAFESSASLTEVSIPESVRKLGDAAFPNLTRVFLHGSMPNGLIRAVAWESKPTSLNADEYDPIECITDYGRRFFVPRKVDCTRSIVANLQLDIFGDTENSLDFLYEYGTSPNVKQICALRSYEESGRPETEQYLRRSAKSIINTLLKDNRETDLVKFVQLGLVTAGTAQKLLEEAKNRDMISLSAYLLQVLDKKPGRKLSL